MGEGALISSVKKGVVVISAYTPVIIALGFLVFFLASRLLAVEEVGLFAFALAIVETAHALVNSTGDRLILKGKRDLALFQQVFTLDVLLAVLVAVIGGFAIWLTGLEGVALRMALILLPTVFFRAFLNSGVAYHERRLEFARNKRSQLIGNVTFLLVFLGCFFAGQGALSLAWGYNASLLCYAFGVSFGLPFRFRFDPRLLRRIVVFGAPLFLAGFVVKYYWQVDDIIVGQVMGATAMGWYWFAFYYPHFILKVQTPFLRMVLPLYARLSADRLRLIYAWLTKYTAIAVIPIAVLGITYAPEFIIAFFGEQWLGATTAFRIYIALIALRATMIYWSDIIVLKERTAFQFRISLFNAAVLSLGISVFVIGGDGSIVTMSWIVFSTILLSFIPMGWMTRRLIGVSYVKVFFLPITLLVGTVCAAFFLDRFLGDPLLVVPLVLGVYVVTVLLLCSNEIKRMKGVIL